MSGAKPRTKPKRSPKVCRAGHRQSPSWSLGDKCYECERIEQSSPEAIKRFREQEMACIPKLPDSFTIRTGDGSPALAFALPKIRRR